MNFIITELNYVPYKELTLLLSVFHNEDSKVVIDEICDFFWTVLHRDKRMLHVFREVGILDMIVKIISHCSRNYGTLSRRKASIPLDFPHTLILSYGRITDLLVLLLQDSENQIHFRHDVNRDIYDCLSVQSIQKDTLKIVKVYIYFLKNRFY